MIRTAIFAVAAATIVTGAAFAAQPTPGAKLGVNAQQIEASLADKGYKVLKYEREHGKIEVYALKDNRVWELKIDPQNGQILRVDEED